MEDNIISKWIFKYGNEIVRKNTEEKLEKIMENKETIEEAAIDSKKRYINETAKTISYREFIEGANWQAEKVLKFILDEDNHTEGELGNSCIDVQTLVHFIEKFKKK